MSRATWKAKFASFSSHKDFTDDLVNRLSAAIDPATIALIESAQNAALAALSPLDLQAWLSTDLLAPAARLGALQSAVRTLGYSVLGDTTEAIHARLLASMDLSVPGPTLSWGSGAVEDFEIPADVFLDQLQRRLCKADFANLLVEAKGHKPGSALHCRADLIAALWQVARQPGSGLKPFIDDPALRKEISDIFSTHATSRRLGSAPVNMARAALDGDITANVTWPFQPDEVARYALAAQRLVCTASGFETYPFVDPMAFAPRRISYIFTVRSGMDVANVAAAGPDRLIGRMRRFATPGSPPGPINIWAGGKLMLRTHVPDDWDLGPDEWPSLPLLGRFNDTGPGYVFESASDDALRAIARSHRSILFNCAGVFDDPGLSAAGRDILAALVCAQLKVLADEGAQIFMELSSVPVDPTVVQRLAQSGVSCVGINQTELVDLTSRTNPQLNPNFAWPATPAAPLLDRFHRIRVLSDFLGADVFCHGNECNLYLARGGALPALRRLADALLLSNVAVISWFLGLAGATGMSRPALAEKGLMSLTQFARDLTAAYLPLDQVPDAMQEFMASGIFRLPGRAELTCLAAPVLWPEEVQAVNTTGGGDIVSAIVGTHLP
jgi:hypothetical protein